MSNPYCSGCRAGAPSCPWPDNSDSAVSSGWSPVVAATHLSFSHPSMLSFHGIIWDSLFILFICQRPFMLVPAILVFNVCSHNVWMHSKRHFCFCFESVLVALVLEFAARCAPSNVECMKESLELPRVDWVCSAHLSLHPVLMRRKPPHPELAVLLINPSCLQSGSASPPASLIGVLPAGQS